MRIGECAGFVDGSSTLCFDVGHPLLVVSGGKQEKAIAEPRLALQIGGGGR